jgi:predicted ABC-type exoprotein transport system permease subunit
MSKTFMLQSVASSNEAIVFEAFICIIEICINVLEWTLKWDVSPRALDGSYKQCSMFTNQFISLRGNLSG